MPFAYVNGIRIAYEEKGSGEPLLLIMGLGASGSLWEKHVNAYASHFRCIMMDNRGAGESDKPCGPYTTRMMAEDSAGLLKALDISCARVAGISMGSATAQQLALAHPEKVRSLLLISSWARCDAYTKGVFGHFRQIRAQVAPNDFMKLLQLWIFTPGYYERHLDDMLEGQNSAAFNPMPNHAFASQCEACITHDTMDSLGSITQPALLTAGSADIFTPLHLSEAMHKRMPKSKLEVFRDYGHAHHWETLDEFNGRTLDFLMRT